MKLGPSLIGAIVGTLVGVAAQIGLESSMDREATWFALVVGLLTGLGARLMAGGAIAKASFIRAGLAALVALAGIFGASYASSELTRKKHVEASQAIPAPPVSSEVAPAALLERDESEPGEPASVPSDDTTESAAEPSTKASTEENEPTPPAREETPEATEVAEPETPSTAQGPISGPVRRTIDASSEKIPRQPLNVWQLICVTVGVLIAYEMSRGGSRHS